MSISQHCCLEVVILDRKIFSFCMNKSLSNNKRPNLMVSCFSHHFPFSFVILIVFLSSVTLLIFLITTKMSPLNSHIRIPISSRHKLCWLISYITPGRKEGDIRTLRIEGKHWEEEQWYSQAAGATVIAQAPLETFS